MEPAVLWEELLPGSSTWSHILKRGTALRIEALEDGCNVGAVFLNGDNPTERLNLPDTLKAQHIARLTAGNVLYSDMGRILCSITADTVGWHDPLGGCSDARQVVTRKYGPSTYQHCPQSTGTRMPSTASSSSSKNTASVSRDLTMNLNLFSQG